MVNRPNVNSDNVKLPKLYMGEFLCPLTSSAPDAVLSKSHRLTALRFVSATREILLCFYYLFFVQNNMFHPILL